MTTQHLMELSHYNKYKMPFYFVKFYFENTSDKRWGLFISKKVNNFFKQKK